jgi:hypothetical protein
MQHTESSGTLCSVIDQIFIQWCEANRLYQAGHLPQKRPVNEWPGSQSRTCSCPAASDDVGDLLLGVPHSVQALS